MHIGKNGEIRRLEECVFNTPKHQRAIRVGHVEDHDPDGMTAAATQRSGKQVGTIAEMRRGALDALFGGIGNVARQGRVVQDNGNRRR